MLCFKNILQKVFEMFYRKHFRVTFYQHFIIVTIYGFFRP